MKIPKRQSARLRFWKSSCDASACWCRYGTHLAEDAVALDEELVTGEGEEHGEADDERGNRRRAVPGVHISAKGHADEDEQDAAGEERAADPIDLAEPLQLGEALGVDRRREIEEDEEYGDREVESSGQVEERAPVVPGRLARSGQRPDARVGDETRASKQRDGRAAVAADLVEHVGGAAVPARDDLRRGEHVAGVAKADAPTRSDRCRKRRRTRARRR